jgi:hypothetical protein
VLADMPHVRAIVETGANHFIADLFRQRDLDERIARLEQRQAFG